MTNKCILNPTCGGGGGSGSGGGVCVVFYCFVVKDERVDRRIRVLAARLPYSSYRFQRSRPPRGGTVRRTQSPANRDQLLS